MGYGMCVRKERKERGLVLLSKGPETAPFIPISTRPHSYSSTERGASWVETAELVNPTGLTGCGKHLSGD